MQRVQCAAASRSRGCCVDRLRSNEPLASKRQGARVGAVTAHLQRRLRRGRCARPLADANRATLGRRQSAALGAITLDGELRRLWPTENRTGQCDR